MIRTSARQIVNRLLEADADPDDIDPKEFVQSIQGAPFGYTQGPTGSWLITWKGKPTWWMGNEKSAKASAEMYNEQHKITPFRNQLESPFDWYMRAKYGKVYPPHSPHYQPARSLGRRRRRVREAEDPDTFDPKDYVKNAGDFSVLLKELGFFPGAPGTWDMSIGGKDTLVVVKPLHGYTEVDVYLGWKPSALRIPDGGSKGMWHTMGFRFPPLASALRKGLTGLIRKLYAPEWPARAKDARTYLGQWYDL